MKKTMPWFMIAALLLTVGCCNPANIGSQPVTLDAQQTGMWCWQPAAR